jgi:hypothetical protein
MAREVAHVPDLSSRRQGKFVEVRGRPRLVEAVDDARAITCGIVYAPREHAWSS